MTGCFFLLSFMPLYILFYICYKFVLAFTLTAMTFASLEIEAAGFISLGQSVMFFHNLPEDVTIVRKETRLQKYLLARKIIIPCKILLALKYFI